VAFHCENTVRANVTNSQCNLGYTGSEVIDGDTFKVKEG